MASEGDIKEGFYIGGGEEIAAMGIQGESKRENGEKDKRVARSRSVFVRVN